MITTQTNLRATATEAYFKGTRDGWRSGEAAGRSQGIILADAKQRSDGRREGSSLALSFTAKEIGGEVERIKSLIAVADTRWEKRRLTGQLEGLKAALKIVTSQA